ncbi:hypothetical protein AYL99_05219 [Fonsecaea erecta]|uniref:Arrestin-like N-terminal domain-containing protein n=1 Tax=Fonsecaea erecta TaxID=1367422 RepID=A0A178ZK98_9EURO|nr:hypothetical protein AYL99_05219 [Fonsecaea erecta]OAP60217.1 hypothetical protein AYL99_05219 [Fonsecaea erecta]
MEVTFLDGHTLAPSKEPYFLGDSGIDGYISVTGSTDMEFDMFKITLEGLLVNTIRCLDWYADTLIQRTQQLLQLDAIKTAADFIGVDAEDPTKSRSTPKCFFHFDIPKSLQSELLGQNHGHLGDLPPYLPPFEIGERHPVFQPRRQGQCIVTYALCVKALKHDKVVATCARSIRIIPTLAIAPPFCVADFPDEYCLARSREPRRWSLGVCRTGDLRIEATQPAPVILNQLTDDTVCSASLSLTQMTSSKVNCRNEGPRTPANSRCTASLMFSTFISGDPRESAPTLKDLSSSRTLCRECGVYAKVEVPAEFSQWVKVPAPLRVEDGDATLGTVQQWKSEAHVTLNFGKLKHPVPSFESSLVSRRYKVDLRIRIAAPYRCKFRLALPVQILYRADNCQNPGRVPESECPPYIA